MDRSFKNSPWCRYANDGIVHCSSKDEAEQMLEQPKVKLQECKLEIHPDKTSIVYCKDSNRKEIHENIEFTFLGYTFRQSSPQ